MVQKKAKKKGKKVKQSEVKPNMGLNSSEIDNSKMETTAVQIQARFEEAQIKWQILAQHGKLTITMENIISRFPVLAVRILDSLDDLNFVNCITVSRSWSVLANNNELLIFKRMRIPLKKLIGGYNDFKEAWKSVMKETNDEMTKELAITYFLLKPPANQDCKHRAMPHSPLHIAAEAGQAFLCEFILKITKYKAPSIMAQKKAKKKAKMKGEKATVGSDIEWTPFYEAAVKGHLEICQTIMWSNFTDFHPRDDFSSSSCLRHMPLDDLFYIKLNYSCD